MNSDEFVERFDTATDLTTKLIEELKSFQHNLGKVVPADHPLITQWRDGLGPAIRLWAEHNRNLLADLGLFAVPFLTTPHQEEEEED